VTLDEGLYNVQRDVGEHVRALHYGIPVICIMRWATFEQFMKKYKKKSVIFSVYFAN